MIRKSNISKGKLSSFNRIQKNLEAVKNKLRAENIKPRGKEKLEQDTPQENIVYEDTPKPKKKASIKEIKAQEEKLLAESIEKAGVDYSQIKRPKNEKLTNARKAKNDEFYTRLCDVENELKHYTEHFKDKTVLCNCDDPYYSAFWKYFKDRFEVLELKKLIGTHYDNKNLPSYAIEFSRDEKYTLSYRDSETLRERYSATAFDLDSISDCKIHWLNGNGDFRSEECLKYLKECDIVVTNPPFSIFGEFIGVMNAHSKKFVAIGDLNSITYKEVFPLILSNKIWSGYSHPKEFNTKFDGGDIRKFGNKMWFTNLDIKKRYEDLILYKTYNGIDYPKYDNYNAINVDKVKDIPKDYYEVMGVPITFLDKHNPDQFEIVGCTYSWASGNIKIDGYKDYTPSINGVLKYKRLFIKRKHSN